MNKVRLTVDSGVLQKPPVTGEVLDSGCHSPPSFPSPITTDLRWGPSSLSRYKKGPEVINVYTAGWWPIGGTHSHSVRKAWCAGQPNPDALPSGHPLGSYPSNFSPIGICRYIRGQSGTPISSPPSGAVRGPLLRCEVRIWKVLPWPERWESVSRAYSWNAPLLNSSDAPSVFWGHCSQPPSFKSSKVLQTACLTVHFGGLYMCASVKTANIRPRHRYNVGNAHVVMGDQGGTAICLQSSLLPRGQEKEISDTLPPDVQHTRSKFTQVSATRNFFFQRMFIKCTLSNQNWRWPSSISALWYDSGIGKGKLN